MAEFEFQVFCSDVKIGDESFLDRLYEAGCDDAVVFFKDGYICLDFSRKSESAEEAVISAINDFKNAAIGGEVKRIEPDDFASLSEIAHRTGLTRAALQKYARGVSKVGKDFPKPAANISGVRRELYSAAEVIDWMCLKERVDLPKSTVQLAKIIAKTNQALSIAKARKDDDVNRLVLRLTSKQPGERKQA